MKIVKSILVLLIGVTGTEFEGKYLIIVEKSKSKSGGSLKSFIHSNDKKSKTVSENNISKHYLTS